MTSLSPTRAGILGGAFAGVFFGVFMGLFVFLDADRSASSAVVVGLAGGLFFGVFTGAWLRHYRQSADRMIGSAHGLTRDELRAASRAAHGGPVPSDRRVAERAVNIARLAHSQSSGWIGRGQTVIFALFLSLALVNTALNPRLLNLMSVTLFAGLLLLSLWQRRRSRRQLERLEEALLHNEEPTPSN